MSSVFVPYRVTFDSRHILNYVGCMWIQTFCCSQSDWVFIMSCVCYARMWLSYCTVCVNWSCIEYCMLVGFKNPSTYLEVRAAGWVQWMCVCVCLSVTVYYVSYLIRWQPHHTRCSPILGQICLYSWCSWWHVNISYFEVWIVVCVLNLESDSL